MEFTGIELSVFGFFGVVKVDEKFTDDDLVGLVVFEGGICVLGSEDGVFIEVLLDESSKFFLRVDCYLVWVSYNSWHLIELEKSSHRFLCCCGFSCGNLCRGGRDYVFGMHRTIPTFVCHDLVRYSYPKVPYGGFPG